MTGAARMAARAAARAGAGLTTIAVSSLALPVYAAALTSIMVQPLAVPEDFECLLDDAHYKAFLIGPGAGTGEETRSRVLAMLETGRPTVLDADALTTFADDPTTLYQAITGPCVLTPHDGEFHRLFRPERRQADSHARRRPSQWSHYYPQGQRHGNHGPGWPVGYQ